LLTSEFVIYGADIGKCVTVGVDDFSMWAGQKQCQSVLSVCMCPLALCQCQRTFISPLAALSAVQLSLVNCRFQYALLSFNLLDFY